jgi:hypothetical protein
MVDGGFVNLELLAVSGPTGYGAFGFPLRVISTGHGTLLANFPNKRTPAFPKTVNLRLRAMSRHGVASHCAPKSIFEKTLGNHNVVVGGAWSIAHGVNMNFTYLKGQTSSLGLGVSATGDSGSWSAGGTFASSKSAEQDYPTFTNNVSHLYVTRFRYGEFLIIKASCDESQQAQETRFAGGATHIGTGAIKATKCTAYTGQGSGTVLDKNSAFTFNTGVDIADVLGINLSAQTGYDTDTTVGFHVIDHGTHNLCGTNTWPGDFPERAQWGKKN